METLIDVARALGAVVFAAGAFALVTGVWRLLPRLPSPENAG